MYLAVTTSPEVLTKLGIGDVCPTRKTNKGRPPTITASGSEEQKEKRFKPWNLPVRQPDERAKRIMLRGTEGRVNSDYEEPRAHL